MPITNDLTKQGPAAVNHSNAAAVVTSGECDEKQHALYDSCGDCGDAVDGDDGELDILATISMHLANQTASSKQQADAKQDAAAKQQGKTATKESSTKAGAKNTGDVQNISDNKASNTKHKESPSKAPQEGTVPTTLTLPPPIDATCTVRQVSVPGAFARRPSQVRSNNGDDDDITETDHAELEDNFVDSDLSIGSSDGDDGDDGALSMPSLNISDAILVSDEPKEIDMVQTCLAACDGGLGWEECRKFCTEDATFSCQCDTLAGLQTLREYAEFFQLFCKACPGVTWTMHTIQWDRVAHTAVMNSTYHCTHSVSVPGLGPEIPTMKSIHTDYCYIVTTDPSRKNKVVHINKVWNDQWALRDLGWLAEAKKKRRSSTFKKMLSAFR